MLNSAARELFEKVRGGDTFSLSKIISLLEKRDEAVFPILEEVVSMACKGYSIGITGPPGSGKSTLIDSMVEILRRSGHRVGVIAVDPSSPFSGGAILGDRIRMQRHCLDPGVFIRSLATRGFSGGLSRAAEEALSLIFAAGFDIAIVETVGVGQTELKVMEVADSVVVVLVPESGGAIQAMKAGIMEIAHIFVVNKSDRSDADALVTDLEEMIDMGGPKMGWRPSVLKTVAREGKGVEDLISILFQHRESLKMGEEERRMSARQFTLKRILLEEMERWLERVSRVKGGFAERVMKGVREGRLNPYTGVRMFMDALELKEKR